MHHASCIMHEDDLKKKDLHIAGRHTALDIFRFAVFFWFIIIHILDISRTLGILNSVPIRISLLIKINTIIHIIDICLNSTKRKE